MASQIMLSGAEQAFIKNLIDELACFYYGFFVPVEKLPDIITEILLECPAFSELEIFLVGEANDRFPDREVLQKAVTNNGQPLVKRLLEQLNGNLPRLRRFTKVDPDKVLENFRERKNLLSRLDAILEVTTRTVYKNEDSPDHSVNWPSTPKKEKKEEKKIMKNDQVVGAVHFLSQCPGFADSKLAEETIYKRQQFILKRIKPDYAMSFGTANQLLADLAEAGLNTSRATLSSDIATHRRACEFLNALPKNQEAMIKSVKEYFYGAPGILLLDKASIRSWKDLGMEPISLNLTENGDTPPTKPAERGCRKKATTEPQGRSVAKRIAKTTSRNGSPLNGLDSRIVLLEQEIEFKKQQLNILQQAKAICDQST